MTITALPAVPAAAAARARAGRLLRRAAPLFVCAALAWIAHALLPASGLRADYYATVDWTGAPVRSTIDGEVSDRQLLRSWRYAVPGEYSVRWVGWLYVNRSGDYLFSLGSDGLSRLTIDGADLIVNARPGGRGAAIHLDPGPHQVVLRLAEPNGGHGFVWSWIHGSAEAIPAWRLSPRRTPYAALVARRLVELLLPLLTLGCAIAGSVAAWILAAPRVRDDEIVDPLPRAAWRPAVGCAVIFAALAIVHTWPLATDPARLSRNDNADTVLNEWTMAWVAHEAPRHPSTLFDANILYPERHTLALSEPLILQGLLSAPIRRLGGSPVLAYNLVLLIGFALTGWATCLVVARWTGTWWGGLASGATVAFNAHTLTRLPHIQAQHAEFLPLALFALDALLRQPRWRAALWLAAWTILQGLASIHTLVFTLLAIVVGVAVRPEAWTGAAFRRVAPKLAGAAVVTALALVPLLLPFWQLHRGGFVRSLDEAAFFAARAGDYLAGQSRLFARVATTTALFPGAAALVLAAIALAGGVAVRDARARMCLASGACGVALSFGPANIPGYEWLYTNLPLIGAIRVSARFGYLGIVAVAVLAGYGVAAVARRVAGTSFANALPAALALVAAIEPLAAPITYTPAAPIPQIYSRAAAGAIVADLPFPPPEAPYRNVAFMLGSTRNWRPLVNGYSGFVPPSYADHYLALRSFPDAASIRGLRALGVTDLFVHLDQLPPGAAARVDADPAVHRIAAEGAIVLYRLDPQP